MRFLVEAASPVRERLSIKAFEKCPLPGRRSKVSREGSEDYFAGGIEHPRAHEESLRTGSCHQTSPHHLRDFRRGIGHERHCSQRLASPSSFVQRSRTSCSSCWSACRAKI